jgi:hypothetical protein
VANDASEGRLRILQWLCTHLVLLLCWHAGGRSAQIDARANRWDAQEYESLKAEREKLKREIDVSVCHATRHVTA